MRHRQSAWTSPWRPVSNQRVLVEADVLRRKRVICPRFRPYMDGCQATEVTIAAEVLNRMLDLKRPGDVRDT